MDIAVLDVSALTASLTTIELNFNVELTTLTLGTKPFAKELIIDGNENDKLLAITNPVNSNVTIDLTTPTPTINP